MRLDDLVRRLDDYFRVPDVRGDDWAPAFDACYPDPYWRDHVEPGYEGRWDGLMVRGTPDVACVATCVFPSDRIVDTLAPETLLFSEHPLDFGDEPGFQPLSRASFQALQEVCAGFYHVHAPLDMHPEVSPSRLCAHGMRVDVDDEYFPIAEGIPGGAAVIGDCDATLDELAARLHSYLGPEIPVEVVTRPRERASRVAVVAGGGAMLEPLEQSIERGCDTYVTGNAVTRCRLDFVRANVDAFNERAAEAGVAVIDGTHYGTEKPPQLAMVEWFRARGVPAEFLSDGPK
ncbi:MAG TPA: Nif3-like dinuclear metal center hexameric protein [Actinomycetota bacterium]|nr:Nif3-like dinuclear metal center hexameric protein [Actinomycetota bacterium]